MQAKNHILLTGAGFTKNFGAPLAAEVWSIILGSTHIHQFPRIREELLKDKELNFELVYQKILGGPFNSDEKAAIVMAVHDAYGYLDSIIEHLRESDISIPNVQQMISRFCGNHHQEPGFFFTLNQDLFLERHYYNGPLYNNGVRPSLPDITLGQRWFTANFNDHLQSSDTCELPDNPHATDALTQSRFYYIKLHGSMNWYGKLKNGTGQKMIIGQGKEGQISSEPLLARYLKIFEDVLCSGEHKLLVIGYSFADTHINQILLKSQKSGLRLYVLQPGSPQTLKERMKKNDCEQLWSALGEYFPYDLKTLFPANNAATAQWKHVRSRFFNDYHGLG